MKCVYCDKKIIKESNEHVIQNALGGQLKSIKICCGKCNNKVREFIDSPFCEIFNPIIGNIHDFAKTDNKKSKPSWTGKALFKHHKIYDVNIKAGKIIDCKALKKELKRNLTEDDFNDFVIISRNFNIKNIRFKNGLRKIAINSALENDVVLI